MFDKFKPKNIVAFFTVLLLVLIVANKQNLAQIPPNTLVANNRSYRITAGLEEVFKPKRNHYFSRFNITDGEFYSVRANVLGNSNIHPIWRARSNSFWLYVNLYEAFDSDRTSFTYAPPGVDEYDSSMARRSFFKKGRFWTDLNGNGRDESEEYLDAVNGNIVIYGVSDNYTFEFDLLLENNVRVIGTFTGKFRRV